MSNSFKISPSFVTDVDTVTRGTLPTGNDSSVGTDLVAWKKFQNLLYKSITASSPFTTDIVSTYSLIKTGTSTFQGGILAPNGDIHFVPYFVGASFVGQKISATGVVSTYTFPSTGGNRSSLGAVLSPNGFIYFIPANDANALVRLSYTNGIASTISFASFAIDWYAGGVLSPDGTVYLVPHKSGSTQIGRRISDAGTVSTYSLVYTNSTGAYFGGVLAPNGDIHFVPYNAPVGQKISAAGVVSTYSLIYTGSGAFAGGVLAPNGDIHFVPYSAAVGQKINAAGVVSTYSLVYTAGIAYSGGVLAPNGDIHFVPYSANRGQKVSASGVVSTYSLVYTTSGAYVGGVLAPNGDIHFVPYSAAVGQKISTVASSTFDSAICMSPWFNKL